MEQPGHVIPKSTLIATYIGLVILSIIMICLSRIQVDRIAIDWIDLKTIKAVTIMGIALVMGIIVAMFLMGLRYEVKLLNLTIFLTNFVFLLIFVAFTWADTSFRAEIDPSFAEQINFESPVKPGEATSGMPGKHGTATDIPAAGSDTSASQGATASDSLKSKH